MVPAKEFANFVQSTGALAWDGWAFRVEHMITVGWREATMIAPFGRIGGPPHSLALVDVAMGVVVNVYCGVSGLVF